MNNLRINVKSLYDFQKIRIMTGNRIAASFRTKLGLSSSDSEESNKDAEDILNDIRSEYKRITDGITRITSKIKIESKIISSYAELMMIQGYEKLLESEKAHEKAIAYDVEGHIMYDWLKGVRGCGPLMSAAILSEVDITKCNTISSLFKYCGLDVVVWFVCKQRFDETAPDKLYKRHPDGYLTEGPAITGTDDNWFSLISPEGKLLGYYGLPSDKPDGFGEGRSRKKFHLEPKVYKNAEGEVTETTGITFNPFLKTKLIGVLGTSFIKLGGPYREFYDQQKALLKNNPKHAEKTPKHIHNMAVRLMVKQFLKDFWVEYRTREGLPVRPPYSVEKLGKAA